MAGRISYYGGIVKDGLVLDLDAAKRDSYVGVGTAWSDISGNGNNGTLTNGPTFNSNNGGSIVFDGVDDLVSLTTLSSLVGKTNVTIDSWFFNNSVVSGFQNIIGQFDGTDGWLINTSAIANQRIIVLVGGGSAYGGVNDTPTNKWFNVILSYDGTLTGNTNRLKIHIDGVERTFDFFNTGTVPSSWPDATSINTTIGSLTGYGRFFNGRIPIVRVYQKTLSTSEILQNYNATRGRFGL
jgi:hypothetical protein